MTNRYADRAGAVLMAVADAKKRADEDAFWARLFAEYDRDDRPWDAALDVTERHWNQIRTPRMTREWL